MRKLLLGTIAAATVITGALAQTPPQKIKTRLDHLAGTPFVMVVSYLPSEITSITCDTWTMLGINSWNHQNDFTIPAGPAVAVLNAAKFNGYCKGADSIKAHTDDGDFSGVLDRGPGNWEASTKLTFQAKP
jgi:hypothetical protein